MELGVKFRSDASGFVTGIRFYKGSANTGTHVGNLWAADGTRLATAIFTNETSLGWQQVNFATPVPISANSVYVASYHAPNGGYAGDSNYFATKEVYNPPVPIHLLQDGASGGNGVYVYGSGGFPTQTYQATNYWVDVLFTTSVGPDTTPPTVTATSPASNAVGVNPANPVTVTFSEAMDPATINATTFELRDPGSNLIARTVTFSGNTATLTPNTPLAASTIYSAKVIGGATGVKDVAGNALAMDYSWSFTTGVDPCATGGNPIVCENSRAGNPASEWDVSGAGDPSIQGFATDISVNRGETVRFKISTPSTAYRLDIYRMGYYQGNGARKVATVQPSAALPQTQPACLKDDTTRLLDCGNWAVSASWSVPASATSGIYFARAVRTDTGGASHIVFVVRDDASTSDVLVQTSDTTWQAYNSYGGDFIEYPDYGYPTTRAFKGSYNRPFYTRNSPGGLGAYNWLFHAEYPMVRWLEANGYDVSYSTGVDSDLRGGLIRNHKVFVSVGHDEYWSGQQRAHVEAARDAGVHLAFFSGNEVYRKIRWESSIDGSGTPNRTMVCYKESNAEEKIDPLATVWTGSWRDGRFSPPADGGRPENALTGTLFGVVAVANDGIPLKVPEADGKMRFWRNTAVASLTLGQTATLGERILGYEFDEEIDNGFRPSGLLRLSSTTTPAFAMVVGDNIFRGQDTYPSGTATHALTLYKHGSGALVFSAGTVQWSWGLDGEHDSGASIPNASIRQATVNLFADMGVQPQTLQAGLTPATASTDTAAPTSAIATPAAGANVVPGSVVAITGTATDTGGQVGGVEVSVDGGATWHPATGRSPWSYNWTAPTTNGSVTIKTRAVDDSGNLEAPAVGITVIVGSGSAPTLSSIAVTPANPTILTGGTQQFTATGTYSDSSTQNLTGQVTWASSSTGVATITIRYHRRVGNWRERREHHHLRDARGAVIGSTGADGAGRSAQR